MKGKGKGTGKDTVMNGDAAEAAVGIPGLGPVMSLDDPTYVASEAFHSGYSGKPPPCELPGFDPGLAPSMDALVGRWVRSEE